MKEFTNNSSFSSSLGFCASASARTCFLCSSSFSTIKRYASLPSGASRPHTLQMWSWIISSISASPGKYHGILEAPLTSCVSSLMASNFPSRLPNSFTNWSFWTRLVLLNAALFVCNSFRMGGYAHKIQSRSRRLRLKLIAEMAPFKRAASARFVSILLLISVYFSLVSLCLSKSSILPRNRVAALSFSFSSLWAIEMSLRTPNIWKSNLSTSLEIFSSDLDSLV